MLLLLCFGWVLFFNYKGHLNNISPATLKFICCLLTLQCYEQKQHLFSYQLSYSYNVTHFRLSFLEYIALPFFFIVGFFVHLFLNKESILQRRQHTVLTAILIYFKGNNAFMPQ